MNRILALAMVCLLCAGWSGLLAQGNIEGWVSDAQTNEALPGANVIVAGTHLGASTDENGYFLIQHVPAGKVQVRCEMLGYSPDSTTITVKNHHTAKLRFRLQARALSGKTVVVKYGGHAMQDPALEDDFARDIVLLATVGIHPIVIHGGGPQIGQVLTQLGIETRFHEGLRVTDERTMDVVEMVLMGLVNGNIVRRINRFGGNAVGLAGKDGNLIRARKMHLRLADNQSDEVDLGQVGEVEEIKPGILTTLISQGFIPVVAPVGQGENGKALNLNADHVAGRIAEALGAEKLILLTDVDGVMDSEKQLFSSLSVAEAEELINEGTI
jgi:acetylglutamate kinase